MMKKGLLVTFVICLAVFLNWSIESRAQDAGAIMENYSEEITVYGQRLPMVEKQILASATPISVVTRAQIEASGAKTVQEVLESVPGVFLHNQTGNPAESTLDLRGFPRGTSLAVFLDGVRLNGIQDNTVRWDVIPLEDVERIEVYQGASGPLYGGGAIAGVVNIITRSQPGIPRLDLKGGAGSFGLREARTHFSGSKGPFDFYATVMRRHARGWRENDGYRFDDGLVRLDWRVSSSQKLGLLLKYNGGKESDPGALTENELSIDRRQSPYNRYDGSRGRHRLAALSWHLSPQGGWAFSAQAFTRLNDRDILTSGRFGTGFFTRGSERLSGLTAETGNAGTWGKNATWQLSAGAEGSRGLFGGQGYFSDIEGNDKHKASSTRVKESFSGLWAQGGMAFGPFHLQGGVRKDTVSYDYTDFLYDANDKHRDFSQSTWRAGTLYDTGEHSSLFFVYSKGYRIPSVVDLFAYPGFYSNPDLLPVRASDWELGWRYIRNGNLLKVRAFTMKMKDEVVFVLTQPAWFIGENQNVAGSRRRGIELEATRILPAGFKLFASGSYLDSTVTEGPYDGSRVPMTSRYQATVGAQWRNADWTLNLYSHWVGPQVLDNDLVGERPELSGYSTVTASVRYEWRALTIEASASNILDRKYLSRGITNGYEDYFTPARPAGYGFAVTWSF